ncbi:pyridoxal phosphate-dependent aminotransferase [Clostridium estertheticum]|uniref:pyridoxal phosphate-dependent aminotransferase n=1 Tax=Clostridium estertheticum TaxID=238834 RepID=UPI00124F244C|nr:histidinol-phosphate transaminase [Clostridium estertheticum]MBZ9618252.1 histidinol-phosphate aminotransferase family protein [Clostridium estertheticum subsp. laramiense]WAG76246.1 histidinol-phosphate aminotransferase family protein [Clostridium estertheticum]
MNSICSTGLINNKHKGLVLPHIQKSKTYIPPLVEADLCRLHMNENLYGPSPKCMDILRNITSEELYKYPYGGDLLLKKVLSENLGINEEMITLNSGSADSLNQVFRSVLTQCDIALLPNPGWSYYKSISNVIDSKYVDYNLIEMDDRYDFNINNIVDKAIELRPKLIVITSPNMPTGNSISQMQLESILVKLPNILIVVDEAYWGFTQEPLLDINYLLQKYKNLIFVRTFSKFFGLASQRIGYILGSKELCNAFSKNGPLFGISYTSQLMAKAAIDDKSYYNEIAHKFIASRNHIKDELNLTKRYKVFDSNSNFLLIDTYDKNPQMIVDYFKKHGYLIRNCSGYGLNSHVRLSIGTEQINEQILSLFKKYHE